MTDPLRRLMPVVRLAPAKLNLTLAVTGRRPDGYHELHSVMVPLALADLLSVAISGATADTITVAGADAGPVPDNLVLRAFAATRDAVGRGWAGVESAARGSPALPPALAARLEKSIPVAAGLAGGSTDAAAAIDAALEAWGGELDDARRLRVAASIGSDVPFFLARGAAIVEGRGERVTRLPPLRGAAPGILLVTPSIRVSTAEVFAAFAAGAGGRDPASTRATSGHIADEWRNGLDAMRLFQRAAVLAPANDLLVATAVVAPEVLAARRALVRLLGRPVGQSGSGPTCWVLYPSLADATAAAATVNSAIASGSLNLPGDGPAFVHATTLEDPRDRNATTIPADLAGAPVPPGGLISIGGEDHRK